MKNVLIILTILIANCSFSQTIIPIENRRTTTQQQGQTYYYKDVNGAYNKFLGYWKYQDDPTNPTKIVEITFHKKEMDKAMSGFEDEIFARVKYTENGVIVYNTFTKDLPNLMYRDDNIMGGFFPEPNNTNKLNIVHYQEPGRGGKTGKLFLEYENDNGVEKLHWKMRTFRTLQEAYRMPYQMTLIKQ